MSRSPGDGAVCDRGQTPHDFALGVGVFLLTVAFVFATLPALAAPYGDDAADVRSARSQRVAATAVDHLSVDGEATVLDAERTAAFLRAHPSGGALRRFFGLPGRASVNVSIRNGSAVVRLTAADGTDFAAAAGDVMAGRPATTTDRVVAFEGTSPCRPACRLVVRVR